MRKIVGPVLVAVLAAGMYFGLKARYGDYGHYTYAKVDLPRAGQLVHTGTDVRLRGVVIGSVSDIQLVGRDAQLTLRSRYLASTSALAGIVCVATVVASALER